MFKADLHGPPRVMSRAGEECRDCTVRRRIIFRSCGSFLGDLRGVLPIVRDMARSVICSAETFAPSVIIVYLPDDHANKRSISADRQFRPRTAASTDPHQ